MATKAQTTRKGKKVAAHKNKVKNCKVWLKDIKMMANLFHRTEDRAFCVKCEKPVDLMTYSKAAEFYKTDLHEIGELAAAGHLHRIHNRRGITMICGNSLFSLFDRRRTMRLNSDLLSFKPADFETSQELRGKNA